jgi:epoxyqueuosine reductase
MGYLTDRRAGVRADPRRLLPSAKSVICVGKLYNGPEPYSTHLDDNDLAWISRYAWGEDYHDVMRRGLERLVEKLRERAGPFDWKICVDTAPLLERAYARRAGLGWIGKNTCLINQEMGSWFFLGELLVSLDRHRLPDRGTVTLYRCVSHCGHYPDRRRAIPRGRRSRLCIAYFTIELRGAFQKPCAGRWETMCSAATSARMCARGTRAPRLPASPPSRRSILLLIWKNWHKSPQTNSAKFSD